MKYNPTIYCEPLSGTPMAYVSDFMPWQPSTWPKAPDEFNDDFHETISEIFRITIIGEIANVIEDAEKASGSLEHRGHVIAIAQLCAIDVISSYAFFDLSSAECSKCHRKDSKINKYIQYIEIFFPKNYQQFSRDIYQLYRNSMIHSWGLFEVGILPDESPVIMNDEILSYGLLSFQEDLKKSIESFLIKLSSDTNYQKNVLARYNQLLKEAKLLNVIN